MARPVWCKRLKAGVAQHCQRAPVVRHTARGWGAGPVRARVALLCLGTHPAPHTTPHALRHTHTHTHLKLHEDDPSPCSSSTGSLSALALLAAGADLRYAMRSPAASALYPAALFSTLVLLMTSPAAQARVARGQCVGAVRGGVWRTLARSCGTAAAAKHNCTPPHTHTHTCDLIDQVKL
jgi:hypothetical protein